MATAKLRAVPRTRLRGKARPSWILLLSERAPPPGSSSQVLARTPRAPARCPSPVAHRPPGTRSPRMARLSPHFLIHPQARPGYSLLGSRRTSMEPASSPAWPPSQPLRRRQHLLRKFLTFPFPSQTEVHSQETGGERGRSRALPQAGIGEPRPSLAPAARKSLWGSSEPSVALPGAATGLLARQAPGLRNGDNETPSNSSALVRGLGNCRRRRK